MSFTLFKSLLNRSAGIRKLIEQERRTSSPDKLRLLKLGRLALLITQKLQTMILADRREGQLRPVPIARRRYK